MIRRAIFNTTAFRLSVGYMFLVTLAVAVTLGTAYLLTDGLITDEVDVIIDTELKSLQDRYAQTGIPGVTDEINLRIDSWGRIGAVYMLVDSNFERIAGNVTHWPFDTLPTETRPEFEIATIEPGRRAVHPVRAAVRTLPGGDHLLVGTDISQGRRFAEKFRIAMLWGIGLTSLAAALTGFWFSYRLSRRVGDVTGTCKRILAGELGRRLPVAGANDEFDALAISVNDVLDRLEDQARTLRATFDSAAHDLRAPLHRLRTRMDALVVTLAAAGAGGSRFDRVGAARSGSSATDTRDPAADCARRVGCAARIARGCRCWRARHRVGGVVRAGRARPRPHPGR